MIAACVLGHFCNRALGIGSLGAMDAMRGVLAVWWRLEGLSKHHGCTPVVSAEVLRRAQVEASGLPLQHARLRGKV